LVCPAIVDADGHEAVLRPRRAALYPKRRRLPFAIPRRSEALCTEWHDVNSVDVVGLAFDIYLDISNE
jgi:hypothetical protein